MFRSRSVLAAAFCLVVLGPACASLGKVIPYPEARILGVDVSGLNLSGITFRFTIEVENPYDLSLPVRGMKYRLSSDGDTILDGQGKLDHVVPPQGSSRLPLEARLPFGAIGPLREKVRPGNKVPYTLELGLQVETPVVGTITLPLEDSGELKLPSLP